MCAIWQVVCLCHDWDVVRERQGQSSPSMLECVEGMKIYLWTCFEWLWGFSCGGFFFSNNPLIGVCVHVYMWRVFPIGWRVLGLSLHMWGQLLPCIPILHFAATSTCLFLRLWYRQELAGGKTVLPFISACFSRQPPALLMPRVDPSAVLSFSCKLVLRNNYNLLNMQH